MGKEIEHAAAAFDIFAVLPMRCLPTLYHARLGSRADRRGANFGRMTASGLSGYF
jgi:hypothetical protein